MARKVLNKNSPGTSGTFAADDWDYINKYLTDVDQTAIDPVSIKTNTSYWDNRLRVWNPAKTKSYRIRGLAIVNDYDLTLPLLSSNDEIVGLLATQTLQNKQINVNNNIIKHGTTNQIGDLLVGTGTKYDRLGMSATGGYVLATKPDLTGLEWVSAPSGGGGGGGTITSGANVGTGGVGVFKQVSGASLQFKKLNTASGGLIGITDDTANSEVDLRVTPGADGQYLKTVGSTPTWSSISSTYGIIMPDNTSYTGKRFGRFMGGATDGDGMFGGLFTGGTMSGETGTTATRTKFTTGAVDLEKAGFQTWGFITRRSHTPRYKILFNVTPSTERVWVGFHGNVSPSGADPLINSSGFQCGFGESDANFMFKWNNGGVTSQSAATAVPKDTALHTVELLVSDATASVSGWFDGTQVVNANTVQVPSTSQPFYIHNWIEAVGATASTITIEYAMLTFP